MDIKYFNKTLSSTFNEPNLMNETSNEKYLKIFQKTSKINYFDS